MYFKRLTATCLVLFACLSASSVAALDLKLTFDDTGYVDGVITREGRVGPISYTNPNVGYYYCCGAQVAIGDDGFASSASIRADEGTLFDLVGFDIIAAAHHVKSVPTDAIADTSIIGPLFFTWLYNAIGIPGDPTLNYDPVITDVEAFDYLRVTGLRDGVVVADFAFDPETTNRFDAPAGFTGLDTLQISTTLQAHIPQIFGDQIFACNTACGDVIYDNVDLRVYDASLTAQVPLPATGLLLAAGLLTLRRLRRA